MNTIDMEGEQAVLRADLGSLRQGKLNAYENVRKEGAMPVERQEIENKEWEQRFADSQKRESELIEELSITRSGVQKLQEEVQKCEGELKLANHVIRELTAELEALREQHREALRSLEQACDNAPAASVEARQLCEAGKATRQLRQIHTGIHSERVYLQAQIDAGNTMWAHYRDQVKDLQQKLELQTNEIRQENQGRLENAKMHKKVQCDLQAERRKTKILKKRVQELSAYALKLERIVIKTLSCRTWRLMEPARELGRLVRRVIYRRPVCRMYLPVRPKFLDE